MDKYSYGNVCIDIVGLVLMLIMLFNFKKKSSRQSFDQKLFFGAGIADAILIVLDAVTWAVDKQANMPLWINNLSNTLLYMCGPFMFVIWCAYYDYKIFKDIEKMHRRIWLYIIPASINAILCLIQLFTPILFVITPDNVYERLDLAVFTFAIPVLYFTFTEILLFVNKKKVPATNLWPLACYGIFPVIGVLLDLLFGVSAIYISSAFAFLIIFFRVQNDLSVTDYLTNLNNRRHLEVYLNEITSHVKGNETIYAIMYDIDDFKQINDEFGHAAGDRALIDLADIFMKNVRKTDFVSRYAGDEFIVVLRMDGKGNVDRVIDDISKAVDRYNRFNTAPFKLYCSYGYTAYKRGEKTEVFLKRLDEEMYFNKNRKKERKNKGLKFY